MFKKVISMLLSILLCMSGITVTFAGESDNDNIDDVVSVSEILSADEALFYYDFEGLDSSAKPADFFNMVDGNGDMFMTDGDKHGTYMSVSSGYSFLKKFDEPIKDGAYLLSFDIRSATQNSLVFTRFTREDNASRSENDTARAFVRRNNVIGNYTSPTGWTVNGIECKVNEWYRVNMWIDLKEGRVTYIINNKAVGTTPMYNGLYGVWFCIESHGDTNDFDNIAMYKATPEMAQRLKKQGISVPDELTYTVYPEISSEYSGNIFKSFDDVKINLANTNKTSAPVEYTAVYSVENYRGDVVWTEKEENIGIDANAVSTAVVQPKIDKFGLYRFKIEYIPNNEDYARIYNEAEFSIVNAPTPGYKDYRFGANIHITKGRTQWDRIKYAIDTLGIGFLRDDITWGRYEYTEQSYGLVEYIDTFLREAKAMGIELSMIFSPNYGRLYGVSGLPTTQTQLDALERACENFAKEYKSVINYVECGNELNFERNLDMNDSVFKKNAKVQQAMYKGLKKGNPDITVLTNGLSRTPCDWVDRFLKEGANGYFDVLAQHPYQGQSTPETTKWAEVCETMRETLRKNGLDNIPVWTTESNESAHYSYFTPEQNGLNLIRQFVLCAAYNAQDKYFFYQMQTPEENLYDTESYFGVLHGQNVKNAYGAKPAYLMTANYIAQTENAEFVDDRNEDDTYVIRFKKPDGSYTVMMYADNSMKKVSLDLGATSATFCDVYGNPQVLSSSDGKYTFVLEDRPVYLSYSGDKFERCEDKYSVKNVLNETYEGEKRVYELNAPENAEISINAPSNLSCEVVRNCENVEISVKANRNPVPTDLQLTDYNSTDNKQGVEYTAFYQNYGTVSYRDYVRVNIKTESGEEYLPLGLEYLKHSADVTATVMPYSDTNTKYWKMKVEVKNNSTDKLDGKITISEPQLMAESVSPVDVSVSSGNTEKYYINIPVSLTKSGYKEYKGTLLTISGEEIPFVVGDTPRSYGYRQGSNINIKPLKKAKGETRIDGVLDEDEWKNYKFISFDKSQVNYGSSGINIAGVVEGNTFGQDADYGGKADFSGTIYTKWDENYLYAAALVYDDVHWQKQDPIRFYYDDVFSLTLCPTKTQRHDTRIDIALSEVFDDNKGRIYRNWTPVFGNRSFGTIEQSEDGTQVAVVRHDSVTIYEARIAWKEIVEQKTFESKNFNISFSIRDYDGDRDKTFSDGGWFCLTE